MAKVLLLEDDSELAANIELSLSSERHVVDQAHSGELALDLLRMYPYELLILDLGLPDMSGMEVCKQYRLNGGKAPVLVLTGKHALNDKTAAFEAGADDYLTKPFSIQELCARLRVLLRRASFVPEEVDLVSTTGQMKLYPGRFQFFVDEKEIELDPKEFKLLYAMMSVPGNPVSNDKLLNEAWGRCESDLLPALRVRITRLRKALADANVSEEIVAVPGRGYALREADTKECLKQT